MCSLIKEKKKEAKAPSHYFRSEASRTICIPRGAFSRSISNEQCRFGFGSSRESPTRVYAFVRGGRKYANEEMLHVIRFSSPIRAAPDWPLVSASDRSPAQGAHMAAPSSFDSDRPVRLHPPPPPTPTNPASRLPPSTGPPATPSSSDSDRPVRRSRPPASAAPKPSPPPPQRLSDRHVYHMWYDDKIIVCIA